MQDHRLEIHPSVVFQLGDRLISDEVTAIVELVKNAYDADATWARVVVDTNAVTNASDSFYPGCLGQVTVQDDGAGMTETEIVRGWLTIANSEKREAKRSKLVTPKFKRTPLGDKGLGRLGVQRLGYVVELSTRKTLVDRDTGRETRGDIAVRVGIDWRSFETRDTLGEVPVEFAVSDAAPNQVGTTITVSQLRNPSVWTSDQAVRSLERKLGQFISPFEAARQFRVYASVNGQVLNLPGLADQLRTAANMRFRFSYEGNVLTVDGAYALTAFRSGNDSAKIAAFDRTMNADRGRRFFEYLMQIDSNRTFPEVSYVGRGQWFLRTTSLRNLDRLKGADALDGQIADPGPFHGEIDAFDFGRRTLQDLAGTALSDLSKLVQQHSGIRIYRDGFAIRPYGMENNDWLELGAGQTSGASYYGLRPRNTVGYVSISANQNAQLEEKTDREGFVESPSTHNFELLMRTIVTTINRTTTELRRQYNNFLDREAREHSGLGETLGTSQLIERVQQVAAGGEKVREAASLVAESVERAEFAAARQSVLEGTQSQDSTLLADKINELVAVSRQNLSDSDSYAQLAAEAGAAASILERDIERLQNQLEEFAELAALGLTAEAISHELSAIASGLMERSNRIAGYIRDKKIADREILTYVEHVRSAASSVRKQLSHLDPGLRFVRERTEVFPVWSFLTQIAEFYSESLQKQKIRILLRGSTTDFNVRMNRGRLTQILDNLILNSKYWLQRDLELGNIERAEIHLELSGRSLLISDTGRGVDPAIENSIFEPFVTNKPRGEGRGLGLFVARQLLLSTGNSVTLLPERNAFGARYIFRVDLEAVAQ